MPNDLTPPTPGRSEHLYNLLKAAIGEIPGGGIVAEFLGSFFGPPLLKRRQEWDKRVVVAIEELRAAQIDIEKLVDDPAFIDTVAQASRIALCTAEQEKLRALQNAIVNSGLPRAVEPDLRQMFLGMIDRFTGWHIRLVVLFDNPVSWFLSVGREFPHWLSQTDLDSLAIAAWPDLKKRADFVEQVCRDLQQSGLVVRTDLGIVRMSDEPSAPRTIPLGTQFVQFIRSQKQDSR